MSLKSRLVKLENHIEQKISAVIYYRTDHQTLEQAKQQYMQENGIELPNHATIICYRRIDTTKVKIQ